MDATKAGYHSTGYWAIPSNVSFWITEHRRWISVKTAVCAAEEPHHQYLQQSASHNSNLILQQQQQQQEASRHLLHAQTQIKSNNLTQQNMRQEVSNQPPRQQQQLPHRTKMRMLMLSKCKMAIFNSGNSQICLRLRSCNQNLVTQATSLQQ